MCSLGERLDSELELQKQGLIPGAQDSHPAGPGVFPGTRLAPGARV